VYRKRPPACEFVGHPTFSIVGSMGFGLIGNEKAAVSIDDGC
jgi:hypothetical protein